MSELRPETRTFLSEALAEDQPRAADRERIRARLAVQFDGPNPPDASALAGEAVSAAGGASAALGSGTTSLLVAAAVALSSGAGLLVLREAQSPPGPRVEAMVALPLVVEPEHLEPDDRAAAEVQTVLPPAEDPRPPSRTRAQVERRAGPGTLAREAELLAEARAALRDGDAARALAKVEEHAARFPRPALLAERWAARGLALCALGRSEEAKQSREHLARLSPGSAVLDRLDEACGWNLGSVE